MGTVRLALGTETSEPATDGVPPPRRASLFRRLVSTPLRIDSAFFSAAVRGRGLGGSSRSEFTGERGELGLSGSFLATVSLRRWSVYWM